MQDGKRSRSPFEGAPLQQKAGCFNCGSPDHWSKDCTEPKKQGFQRTTTTTPGTYVCPVCFGYGHGKAKCANEILRDKKAILLSCKNLSSAVEKIEGVELRAEVCAAVREVLLLHRHQSYHQVHGHHPTAEGCVCPFA